jgi:DNA mismatch repair protein MutS
MGRLEEYEQFYLDYTARYGSKTVILYQFGKFHETYGIDNDTEKLGNVTEIADLLGIRETRVNTNILENNRKNPQMAGFNSVGLDERIDKLINYGYTVIVVNQIAGTDPIQRDVAYIQSPSTSISSSVSLSAQDPYLVSIYLDQAYNKSTQSYYSYIGMAAIDTTTGASCFYESNSTVSDPTLAEDDLTRFLQTYSPVEIVLNRTLTMTIDPDLIYKWGYRDKNDANTLKPTVFTNTAAASTLTRQEEYLSQHFKDHGFLNVLEYLDLVKYDAARTAYVHLLDFCSNHNAKLLTCLSKPKLWGTGKVMVLDTSGILQLNIIESYYNQNRQESVVSMLSRFTKTAMGRRVLRERLLGPVVDVDILRNRYQSIEAAQSLPSILDLGKIKDLDRLHRKLTLGTLTPSEFYILDKSYNVLVDIIPILTDPAHLKIKTELENVHSIQTIYHNIIDIEEAGKCTFTESIRDSIFKLGWNKEIDHMSSQIRLCVRSQEIICQKLSDMIAKGSSYCKYKEDQTGDSCYCSMTKAQFKKFKSQFGGIGTDINIQVDSKTMTLSFSDLIVDDRNKSNVKFQTKLLSELLDDRKKIVDDLRCLSITLYGKLLKDLTLHYESMKTIAQATGLLDLYVGMAIAKDKYGYCKPIAKKHASAFLKTQRLRHPLVERHTKYIPQDISLGTGAQGPDGMLLYGVNQTGKSCTMKSVGVAIIMAQAGFYVPAESFVYSPYELLTTRILGNDNIDRGLSTFAVEMIELRSILTRCTNRSLNLGDEVCHGTESASAVSIVAASIMHMSKMNANFIFATHLHELSSMTEVTVLDNIKHYHLTVEFEGDKIIYNRLMKEGSGLGLYGIEVAKHLKLPAQVLEDAYSIRNKYFSQTPKLSDMRESRYNSKVLVSHCKIPNCNEKAVEVHHIRYQSEGVLIDGHHKNNKDNLVPLCQGHHDQVHGHGHGHGRDAAEILVIFGYNKDGTLDCKLRKLIPSLE